MSPLYVGATCPRPDTIPRTAPLLYAQEFLPFVVVQGVTSKVASL